MALSPQRNGHATSRSHWPSTVINAATHPYIVSCCWIQWWALLLGSVSLCVRQGALKQAISNHNQGVQALPCVEQPAERRLRTFLRVCMCAALSGLRQPQSFPRRQATTRHRVRQLLQYRAQYLPWTPIDLESILDNTPVLTAASLSTGLHTGRSPTVAQCARRHYLAIRLRASSDLPILFASSYLHPAKHTGDPQNQPTSCALPPTPSMPNHPLSLPSLISRPVFRARGTSARMPMCAQYVVLIAALLVTRPGGTNTRTINTYHSSKRHSATSNVLISCLFFLVGMARACVIFARILHTIASPQILSTAARV